MPKVKILVAYHKPAPVLRTDVFTPIHVGRALADRKLRHQLRDMIGDDTGDHISARNPHYGELTAAYWAWKNLAQLGDPDYIGLFHYRRFLNFGDRVEGISQFDRLFSDFSDATCRRHGWTDDDVKAACSQSDILLPQIEPVLSPRDWKSPATLFQHYRLQHPAKSLHQARSVLLDQHPSFEPIVDRVLKLRVGYFCNLFILRREIFCDYMSWLFGLFFVLERRIDLTRRPYRPPSYQSRVFGFLAERLLNVYVAHRKALCRDRVAEFQFLCGDFGCTPCVPACPVPKVSILLPVYNVKPFLAECLDSLVRQTLTDMEIIAVDDGSTDGSDTILDAYARRDRRIKVVAQRNSGLAVTRNVGLRHATGEYTAFVDGDDFCDETMMEKLYRKAIQTEADIVTCSVHRFEDGHVDRAWVHRDLNWFHTPDEALPIGARPEQFLEPAAWCKLFRTAYARSLPCQFTQHSLCCEDAPFITAAFLNTSKIAVVPEPLYYYRIRKGSLTHRMSFQYVRDFVDGMQLQRRIVEDNGGAVNREIKRCISEFKLIMATFVFGRLGFLDKLRFFPVAHEAFEDEDYILAQRVLAGAGPHERLLAFSIRAGSPLYFLRRVNLLAFLANRASRWLKRVVKTNSRHGGNSCNGVVRSGGSGDASNVQQ